jgi:hypothetical protein
MLKLAVAAMAALCLAVPTVAAAEDHAHAVDHITCGDGTVLTPPFSSPVCAEHGAVASVTCASGATLTPPLDGKRCPAAPEGDGPSAPPEQPAGDAPSGDQGGHGDRGDTPRPKAGFLNRVWRIAGSADGFQDGVLDFTADRIVGLPHRFASQDDALVGQDARVLVTARTRVFDADHHSLSGDAQASALDAADTVVVMAKLLPQAKWQQDEDGTPVPTLRAKKIVIRS